MGLSSSGNYMWWLLPSVRKQKPPTESRLFGLLDAVGVILDELKTAILIARLRRYASVQDGSNSYYTSSDRSDDLGLHAGDRELRRLPGESDDALLERILTLTFRNRFLGTKAGMRYLIEDMYRLRCDQIVEYYADDLAWIVLSESDQKAEVEANLSHIFDGLDQGEFTAYRGIRVYSESDLTQAFHFWISISNPLGIVYDPEVVREAIVSAKPAHTRGIVHFAVNPQPAV